MSCNSDTLHKVIDTPGIIPLFFLIGKSPRFPFIFNDDRQALYDSFTLQKMITYNKARIV